MPDENAHELDYKGHKIVVFYDSQDHAEDPRSEDYGEPYGHMLCWHSRRKLGDKHEYRFPANALVELIDKRDDQGMQYDEDKLFEWAVEQVRQRPGVSKMMQTIMDYLVLEALPAAGYVVLPLYTYEHGGITMATKPFGCEWDASQVGFICYGKKDAEKDGATWDEERIKGTLESVVRHYDHYLQGDVYGVRIWKDGEPEPREENYGYIGSADDCLAEAKSQVDAWVGNEQATVAAG